MIGNVVRFVVVAILLAFTAYWAVRVSTEARQHYTEKVSERGAARVSPGGFVSEDFSRS